MLAKRSLSAVTIAGIGFLLILSGGWVFTIGIALILAIAVWEFIRMFQHGGYHPNPYTAIAGTFIITTVHQIENPVYFSTSTTLVLFAICAGNIWRYKQNQKTAAVDLVVELAAIAIITIPGNYLIDIRGLPNGLFWALGCVLPASVGDVGAYLVGSLFGHHKLAPLISPNKTVEGYLGGIFAAGMTGAIFGLVARTNYHMDMPIFTAAMIGTAVGVLTPLGDLTKSIIKRNFSLKDTGDLIPGHGGMLDRIDTILWAAPITYFLIYLLAG